MTPSDASMIASIARAPEASRSSRRSASASASAVSRSRSAAHSSAERTNESADEVDVERERRTRGRARPSRSAKGSPTRHPGRFTPLWILTRPPTTTAQAPARHRPRRPRAGRARRRSSSRAAGLRLPERSAASAHAVLRAPSCDDEVALLDGAPAARAACRCGSSGPAGRRAALSACRRAPARSVQAARVCAWFSCVPWEKLSRAASIPAATRASTVSCDEEAGPIVQTIFVRRRPESTPPTVARCGYGISARRRAGLETRRARRAPPRCAAAGCTSPPGLYARAPPS